jgi:drug/metabolite transporter (DMT)-like permease
LSAIAIALAAALSWGCGDFLGGLKARTLPALTVVASSQPFGLAALAIAVTVAGRPFPDSRVFWACPAAVLGTVGVVAFYRGLAAGEMAVVAPIAGAGAVVPVAVGLATGDRPGTVTEIGFVLAIAGVVAASREPGSGATRLAAGAGWGIVALLCFGGYFIPMRAASEPDFLWASFLFRLTSVPLAWTALLALRYSRPRPLSPHLVGLVLIGLLDTGGNVLFALASTLGLISVVAVLASLYPVVTVLLARWTLHERPARSQLAGVAAALSGVALIAVG